MPGYRTESYFATYQACHVEESGYRHHGRRGTVDNNNEKDRDENNEAGTISQVLNIVSANARNNDTGQRNKNNQAENKIDEGGYGARISRGLLDRIDCQSL